jgi:hypothetical protein
VILGCLWVRDGKVVAEVKISLPYVRNFEYSNAEKIQPPLSTMLGTKELGESFE